jgi:hypothetical protein
VLVLQPGAQPHTLFLRLLTGRPQTAPVYLVGCFNPAANFVSIGFKNNRDLSRFDAEQVM